ncbi:Membrane protein insertase YidC [Azospirillaceae bacterium]
MNEQRNILIAVLLSILILLGFQFLYETPRIQQAQQQARIAQAQAPLQPQSAQPQPTDASAIPTTSSPPGVGAPVNAGVGAPTPIRDRRQIIVDQLSAGQRLPIVTPALHGSLTLIGGRIDDLTLADYHETPDPNSAEIVLLSPSGSRQPYYAEFGWTPEDRSIPVPDANTHWTSNAKTLTPNAPVTLSWENGQGLIFERTITVDEKYLFTITQRVRNTGNTPVKLLPYGLVSRHGTPSTMGYYILHEGPLGVFDGTLKEVNYKNLKEEKTIEKTSSGGWIGVTDKYWLVSLIPDQEKKITARFLYTQKSAEDRFQVDILGESQTAAPGETIESMSRLFSGAKQVHLLGRYERDYSISKFDLAIDFGWFYFLTKPFFLAIDLINYLVGNFGIAILIFTVIIKALFFPLANKSYVSMSKMKKLQPEVQRIRERFANDKMRMNQEMMELYKREKANPVSGCLPVLVQIPVFFSLYKVLFVTIEMRHAPFFGWIQDLSAPDPTSLFNLFGLIPWTPPQMLMIGVWPLIMGVTMWLQQKLNPAPPDPVQQKVFMFLPILFTFMLANFPAGLVIYWAWNNSLSIAQQWLIMKKMGVKAS